MALESADYITRLDPTAPRHEDPADQGDDHIRVIKQAVRNTFSRMDGPVTITPSEANQLTGSTQNVQAAIDALEAEDVALRALIGGISEFPSGTRMVFYQASAPAGWTQVTSAQVDNAMLRVVSNAGGGHGGSTSPISWTHSHGTSPHTLTVDQMPAHTHDFPLRAVNNGPHPIDPGASPSRERVIGTHTTESTGGGEAHSHGNTAAINWRPRYIDMIVCERD